MAILAVGHALRSPHMPVATAEVPQSSRHEQHDGKKEHRCKNTVLHCKSEAIFTQPHQAHRSNDHTSTGEVDQAIKFRCCPPAIAKSTPTSNAKD